MKRKFHIILARILVVLLLLGNCAFSVSAESEPQIKNVIYMIPDGGGMALFDFTNAVKESGGFQEGLYPNATKVEKSPMNMKEYFVGTETTRSYNNEVTDSAASGTALSSGFKTNNAYVGLDHTGVPRATILETAQFAGKRTGIVTTATFHHATPAAFTSHNVNRDNSNILAKQIVNQKLDVVLTSQGFSGLDFDAEAEITNNGYSFVKNKSDLLSVTSGDKIWGKFGNLPKDIELDAVKPNLAEMTSAAIKALDGSDEGFFLMVEGSSVDSAAHDNNLLNVVSEYLAFDAAFKVALDYAKGRNDTIIVVLPDHDTGGLNLPGADSIGSAPDYSKYKDAVAEVQKGINSTNGITWSSLAHTRRNGGIFMYVPEGVAMSAGLATTPGYNSTNKTKVVDNTAIAPYLAKKMGIDLDEASENLFIDVTPYGTYDSETEVFTFDDVNISIEANTSVATVSGVQVDLNGEVSVYSKERFYVPKALMDIYERDFIKFDGTETVKYIDKTDGKVLVKGQVESIYAGSPITLLLRKKNKGVESIGDIGYLEQSIIQNDGSYVFKFIFDGNIDEYELRMNIGDKIVTDSIIEAKASYTWLDTSSKLIRIDSDTVTTGMEIVNHFNLDNLSYEFFIVCYDENRQMIGMFKNDNTSNKIEGNITEESITLDLPEGTKYIKSMVWSEHSKLIPLVPSAEMVVE